MRWIALVAVATACVPSHTLVRSITVIGDGIFVEKCALTAGQDERDVGRCSVSELAIPQPKIARSRAELGLPAQAAFPVAIPDGNDDEHARCVARRHRMALDAQQISTAKERARVLMQLPDCGPVVGPP
jgi:hypothetical protein